MKILYYYPEQNNVMFQWQRFHFFDELDRYGIKIDVINPLDYENFDQVNESIIKMLKECKYDLFFSNFCFDEYIYPETLRLIRTIGVPSLCFRPDNLSVPMRDKHISPLFDLVWLTAKETQYLYDKWGAKTMFAPYAANPYVYKYNPGKLVRRVCFIGVPHGSRSLVLNTLMSQNVPLDIFCKNQINNSSLQNNNRSTNFQKDSLLRTYINRLRFKEGRKILLGRIMQKFINDLPIESKNQTRVLERLPFDVMIQNYSNYALALSFTTYGFTGVLKHPLNILNLRNFEIPMCGGLQFCQFSEESAEYFENGKEIVMYENHEEMIDKALYFTNKASESEIMNMKLAARKRAESEHTWINRFNKAFEILNLKY